MAKAVPYPQIVWEEFRVALAARRFAALVGIVFSLLGVIGLFTNHLFGLFHLGTTHTVIHFIVGILGLLAASRGEYAFRYAQALGIVYMAMAVLGVFTGDLFGLMRLGMSDNVLHFAVGAIALYFGFVLSESGETSNYSKAR